MTEFDLFVNDRTETRNIKKIGNHRTLTKYEPPEREFVEPDTTTAFIHWLFRYRCIICKKPGSEINEIIPRSRSKKSIGDWRNRVLLCGDHHREFHKDGVTNAKIEKMQEVRLEFLKSFDRAEYAN